MAVGMAQRHAFTRSMGAWSVAAGLLAGGPALAAGAPATPPLDFQGVTEASLMASPLTPDSIPCGLDLGRLVAAARQPLANGGLALRDGTSTRVTVSAVTVRVAGTEQCATTVLLGVYAQQSFFSATAGWLRSGYVVIWQRALAVATPAGAHAAAVSGVIGRLADQMLAAWHAQGQGQGQDQAGGQGDGQAQAQAPGQPGRMMAQDAAGNGK
jgi:hypothetical protein